MPAVEWCFDNLHKRRFFFVGSDYLWPHATNELVGELVKRRGGEIVGTRYFAVGSAEVAPIVDAIIQAQPEMILEAIAGDSKVAFCRMLRAKGVLSSRIPVMSFSTMRRETQNLGKAMAGDYSAWSYFSSLATPENHAFVNHLRARFSQDTIMAGVPLIDDPVESTYYSVYLWAQAITRCGSIEVSAIRKALRTQRILAPEGEVRMDPGTRHAWKVARIAQMMPDGHLQIVYTSKGLIQPIPFPAWRTRAEWEKFLNDLYQRWGGHWANPGP